jgi:hypothetical protein
MSLFIVDLRVKGAHREREIFSHSDVEGKHFQLFITKTVDRHRMLFYGEADTMLSVKFTVNLSAEAR